MLENITKDVQVTVNPLNAKTGIVMISWTRWMPHILLSFK